MSELSTRIDPNVVYCGMVLLFVGLLGLAYAILAFACSLGGKIEMKDRKEES